MKRQRTKNDKIVWEALDQAHCSREGSKKIPEKDRIFPILLVFFFAICLKSFAIKPVKLFAEPKEKIEYTVFFKWGVVTPKAGTAFLVTEPTEYNGSDAYRYKIMVQSSRFFNSIYSLKDTMASVMTPDFRVREFSQNKKEQHRYKTSVSRINYDRKNNPINYQLIRHREGRLVEDTTILLPKKQQILDSVGAVAFLRSIDYSDLHLEQEFPVVIIDSKDVINAVFRYKGQSLLEDENKRVRYATHRFTLDVYDDAFTRSKDAMEVWIGDDKNRLPIKIRSVLKVGAGVVMLRKASGLTHPFTCRVYIR